MFISLSDFDFVFHVSYDFYLSFVVDNHGVYNYGVKPFPVQMLSDTILQ